MTAWNCLISAGAVLSSRHSMPPSTEDPTRALGAVSDGLQTAKYVNGVRLLASVLVYHSPPPVLSEGSPLMVLGA
jgi:hypothetical protein